MISSSIKEGNSAGIAAFSASSSRQALSAIFFFAVVFLVLYFRDPGIFVYPAPHPEDFGIFLSYEYTIGFPDTAFMLYSGYIHLLPRIIAWISMKSGLGDALATMNWIVLAIKLLIFYLILTSKDITSGFIKFSLLSYLILVPFAGETYNNVTNLQWWLILLMAILCIKHENNVFALLFNFFILILAGLTGINSVMFALPCAYLILKDRSACCIIKNSAVIICGCIQLYCMYSSPRIGKIMYNGGGIDIINLFVNRVVYHTLFNFSCANSYINIFVFVLYFSAFAFNIYYYRSHKVLNFIFLFAAVYATTILYYLLRRQDIDQRWIFGFWGERYFVFLRICSLMLFVSSLNILFKTFLSHTNYKKSAAYTCFLLCAVLLKNYPVYYFPSSIAINYNDDIRHFESASTGENVKVRFPASDYFCKMSPPWICVLTKH